MSEITDERPRAQTAATPRSVNSACQRARGAERSPATVTTTTVMIDARE